MPTRRRYEGFEEEKKEPEMAPRKPAKDTFFTRIWEQRRADSATKRAAGMLEARVHRRVRIHLIAPESQGFRLQAFELGGRWRTKSGIWSFPVRLRRPLAALIAEHYGAGAVPLWMREGEK